MMKNENNSFMEEIMGFVKRLLGIDEKEKTTTLTPKGRRSRQHKGSFSNLDANAPGYSDYPCEMCNLEDGIQNKDVDFGDKTQSNDADSTEPVGEIAATAQTDDWGLKEGISNPTPATVTTEDGDQEKNLFSDSEREDTAIQPQSDDSDRTGEETAVVPLAEEQVAEVKVDDACIEKADEASIENKDNVDTGADQCASLNNVNENITEAALLKLKLKFMSELIEAEEKIKKILKSSEIDNDSREFIISYIDDVMFFNGATPIEDETLYNPLRHKPSDHGEYPHDTPIVATVFQGIEMDDRVLRRAVVDVKENN